MDNNIMFKVPIVGDSGVGKTCLLKKLLNPNENFEKIPKASLFLDFHIQKTTSDGKIFKIQFIDTMGMEKYRSVVKTIYKDADAFLIVFDVNDEISFDNITYWILDIKDQIDFKNVDLILIANKCDLERKVSEKRVENFEKKNDLGVNYNFFNTSAFTGLGVYEVFDCLTLKLAEKIELKKKQKEQKKVKVKVDNSENNDKQKKKRCC